MSARRRVRSVGRPPTAKELAALAAKPSTPGKWRALLDSIEAEAVYRDDARLAFRVANARFDGPGDTCSIAALFTVLAGRTSKRGDIASRAFGEFSLTDDPDASDVRRERHARQDLAKYALMLSTLAGFLVTPIAKERAR